jgi:hydrogenase expression/formation protein HypC
MSLDVPWLIVSADEPAEVKGECALTKAGHVQKHGNDPVVFHGENMCVAFPMRIERLEGQMAFARVGTIESRISVHLVDKVKKGDYVLVHAGMAIEKIDPQRAREILGLIQELGRKTDERAAGGREP